MRVLFITFIRPSSKFGGGISTLQSLKALSECADLDYMGIDYDADEFDSYKIKIVNKYIIHPEQSKVKLMIQLFLTGNSSSYYSDWVEQGKKHIVLSDYDCVFLDYTRHSFVAEWAKKQKTVLIVRSHNIEADYFKSLYKKKKTISNYIRIFTGRRNEKRCLSLADKVLVLTENEKSRYVSLYHEDSSKFFIYPQCVKEFTGDIEYQTDKPYVLITGSLWFGPNADGAEWFVDNVWMDVSKRLNNKYKLVIAGANPNDRLVSKCQSFSDIELIENPPQIGPYYKGASLYVVPIFYGAGMKVKVAEALACGLTVIATTHSLAGYDSGYDYMREANTKEEFIYAIIREAEMGIGRNKKEILNVYRQNYSLEASMRIMADMLNDVRGNQV